MGNEKKDYEIWLEEYSNAIGEIEIDIGNISLDSNYSGYHDDIISISGLDSTYDDWLINSVFDKNSHDNIKLTGGGEEMLRVDKDGFYVRGVKVEADAREAEQVYKAFKEWLAWASLSRNDEE